MATDHKTSVFNHISIAAQIIDGSIQIDSRTEYENVLQLFPNDPALLRAYADLLVTKNSPEIAAESYAEAAKLFLDSGMILQAIVSKSLHWKIRPPSDAEQIREFFTLANKNRFHQTPVNVFIHTLSYSALVSILYPLEKIRLPAGGMVKKVGDEEKYLYIVVSGALRATKFEPANTGKEIVYKKSTLHLSENDYFGDIHPFEDRQQSKSYVEAITESELLKIPKINLMKECVKFPEVEGALANLFACRSGIKEKDHSLAERMGNRHQVPVKIHLQVQLSNSGNPPLNLTGYSRDISIGGICVVLDAEPQDNHSSTADIKNAHVQVSLPSEDFTVSVPGKIVWIRQVNINQDTATALGIQYREMSPKSQGLLLGIANSLKTD